MMKFTTDQMCFAADNNKQTDEHARLRVEPPYEPRFINPMDAAELVNLYHLARTALAGERAGRYERMCWAAKWFAKEHRYVTANGAYKDLDGLLS
ncbi:MAG: hypothetical protein ACHQU0_03275 [Candidatus Paceibacteria bacterium]